MFHFCIIISNFDAMTRNINSDNISESIMIRMYMFYIIVYYILMPINAAIVQIFLGVFSFDGDTSRGLTCGYRTPAIYGTAGVAC